MIPDLDRYAATVLGAYAVTLAMLALLVAVSWVQSTRIRRQLAQLEGRIRGGRDGRE